MRYLDSVYGEIYFPDKYKYYLELLPLTRLRNIKQLGFTPSVYTGTVHSRFEHTIGKTWILINLLEQFQIKDHDLKERYILAALFSEIGTFPYSYSTNWLFAKNMGLSKKYFAEKLFDTYIAQHIAINDSDREFILNLNTNQDKHNWFRERIPSIEIFPNLSILKLAGDIDYSLRDSHYSGRYSNNFDFRYFKTLVDLDSDSCQDSIFDSIRELYRSIYSLNSVYGDKIRRFITLIFVRLTGFLVENQYLYMNEYNQASKYIELDDDKFMSILRTASEKAIKDNHSWVKGMFENVEQLNSVEIQEFSLPNELLQVPLIEIERVIAEKEHIDQRQVIAISDNKKNILDYVLFGKKFECFKDAIESDFFKIMTGLSTGSNRTNLMKENSVFYTIIK